MAKIFNEKIIESLRKAGKLGEDLDSSGYDIGETYMIQQIESSKRKKPVFRRKIGTHHAGSGDGQSQCGYCKLRSATIPLKCPPIVSNPVPCPRYSAGQNTLKYSQQQSQSYSQHSHSSRSDGKVRCENPSRRDDTESDRERNRERDRDRERSQVKSPKCAKRKPSEDSFSSGTDQSSVEPEMSAPSLATALNRSSSKVPGLCYEGLCDPPGRLDYKNVSFFRSFLGPYPDEPLLALIDKFLSLIGFGGGLCAKDMSNMAMLDDVAEYMPDYE